MNPLALRLQQLDSCAVCDALDQLGLTGAVIGIPRLSTTRRIAGVVRTLELGPVAPGLPKRHLGTSVIASAAPGEVVVVAHGGRLDVSGWGGLLSRGAVQRGVAGVIVDGACRDIDEAREMGLPVFARATVPITARGRVAERSFDQPVEIGGVAVCTGDLVIADGSGIIFMAAGQGAQIIEAAERIARRESLMAADIEAGKPITEVLAADYEDMLRREAPSVD